MDLSSLLKRISSIGLLCLLMLGQIKTIAQVTDFTVLSTNETCPGNGTISVQATGINAQTRFALISPSTQLRPQQELPEFLAVPAGTYTVAVYQGANLVGVKVATVLLEYASPSITNVVEATAYEIPCVAAGTLTVHDNKGMLNVKEPFEYSIDGVNFQSSNVFKGLVKGSYQVTLRDACGATVVRAAQVTEDLLTPTPIVLSRNVNNFAFALGAGACTYDFNPAIVDVNSKSPTLEYRMRLGNNAWSAWTAYANKTSIAANAANRDMITSTSNLIGVEVRDNCKPENVATINVGMAVRPLNDRQPGEGFCETGTKKNVELVFISAVDNSTSTPAASLVGGTVKYRIFEIDGTDNEVIGGDAIPETNWPTGAHLVKHELVPNKRYKALVYNECGIVIEKIIVVAPIAKKQLQRRTQPDGCDKNAGRLAVLDLPNGEPNAYPMTVKAIEQVTGRLLGSVTINSEPANTMATVVVASGIAAGVRYDMEVTFNCPGADYVARNLTMPNFVYDVQTVFEPIELVSGNFDLQLTPTYTGFSNTSIGGSTVRHKIIDGPAGYPTNVLVGMRNLKWSNLAPGTYTIVNYMVSTYGNNQDKPECYMNVYTVELTAGGVLPILVDGIRSGGLICSGLTTGTLSVIMEDMQPDYRFQYRRKADGGPYTPYFAGTVGPEGNTVFSVSGLTLGVYEFNISNSFGSTPYEFEMLDANSINIIHANPTDGVLCLGQPLELNAGPIGTVISFSWEKDGAVISTEASISITEVAFSDAGEYILKIVTNEGCTIENAIQVVVNGCSADLEVVKTADSYAKKVGQEIVFTLDVKNYGPAMAVNTVLTDILKSGFSFVSAVASIGNYDETTGLWTIGDLDVDQEAQLTIRALVLETGDTNNVADVESDTQDNELDNNQSAIFITVTNLLVANDDTPASINGKDGGTTVSVLDNDTLNGNVVDPTEVSLTPGVSPHANITMNGDGAITVTPETPAGTYFYPYSICEVLNPTNCSSAEVTIVVDAALLVANDDTPASINGKDGGTTVSVLDNDTLNGNVVDPTEVSLTPGVSPHANITMNGDGTITVTPETPAGTYFYPYSICEVLNPTNCSSAEVTIVVDAALLVANDDTPASINGKDGGTTVSVLDNDTLNGTAVDPTEVSLTPGVSPHANITMNGDGTITVTPETPAGTYIYPYTICEVLNPTNCSSAEVTIVVDAALLVANDDTPASINGKDGGTTVSVLENDTLNGTVVDPTEVSLTPGVSPHANITMNGDGTITVTPETPAGTYFYPYTICEVLNPTNCSTANVTITFTAGTLVANDDTPASINGKDGGTTVSVLNNDTLNGKVVNSTEVSLTPGVSPHTNITMNGDGTITVTPETPAGTYIYPYTICDVLNPTNCSTANVTITVTAALIKANDDTPILINGKDGGITVSVLENDTLNGKVVKPAEVHLRPGVSPNAGFTMNGDGTVTVAPKTPAGTYTYPYTICEVLNPTNCSTAEVRIVVELIEIIAEDDAFEPINGENGGTTLSVLANDRLNLQVVNPADIKLTWLDSAPAGLTLNPEGTITVRPGTAQGTHTIRYRICELLNPNNCDEAIATVTVAPAPIIAVNDAYKVAWSQESIVMETVLKNDKFNNGAVNIDKVTLVPGVSSNPGLFMNPDGTIMALPGTRPGTYTYTYTICEVLNPNNCSSATATITIEASSLFIPNVFTPNGDGVNDVFEIIGLENYDKLSLTILNRWGNEVYRSEKYNNSWAGRGLNEGTYFYIIKLYKDDQFEVMKGWVLIKK